MTERGWKTCTHPCKMLEFLRNGVGERKVRLFATACVRQVWYRFRDERSRQAVEVTERYADGKATEDELAAALGEAEAAWTVAGTVDWVPTRLAVQVAQARTCREAEEVALSTGTAHGPTARGQSLSDAANLLRDLFGNPFRPLPPVDHAWVTWKRGTVRQLAEAAYDERVLPAGTLDPARLAVLADVLEEAGCQDPEVRQHLREPGGVHVRGCHVVDLLLGKS